MACPLVRTSSQEGDSETKVESVVSPISNKEETRTKPLTEPKKAPSDLRTM
jgi:hypothetical protein